MNTATQQNRHYEQIQISILRLYLPVEISEQLISYSLSSLQSIYCIE